MNQDNLKPGNYVWIRKILPYIVLVVILLLTAHSWRVSTDFLQAKAKERFDFRVSEITNQIIQRLKDYETLLRGGAGLFVATGAVTRKEWRDYVNTLDIGTYYPGVQGIGFVKVLAPSEIEKHVQEIRAEGFPDYTVHPVGDRRVYTSIVYIEPFDQRNRRALGYDMFSEPTRRAAMEQARDTGKTQISGKVKLVQEIDKDVQPGFVMYLPLYKEGDVISTVKGNQSKLFGYVGCPFRMRNFIDGVFANTLQETELKILDGDGSSENSLMYDNIDDHQVASNQLQRLFTDKKTIDLYGHQWTLVVSKLSSAQPSYLSYGPLSILVLGSAIAFLAFLLVRSVERTKDEAIVMANDMTKALKEKEITLEKTNRALRMISVCNENLIGATDELEFMKDVCHIAVTEGGYRFAWVGIAEKNEEKTVRVLAQHGFSEGYLDQVRISYGDERTAKGPMGRAIRTGTPCIFKDIDDPDFLPWKAEAEKRGYRSVVSLPLFVDGEIFGALTLYSSIPDDFDEDDVKLLKDLASDLGFGIATLRTRALAERSRVSLERSEAFLQQIVENIPNMIFVKDAQELRFVRINKAGEEMLGFSRKDLIGKNDYDFFPREQADFFTSKDREVLSEGKLVEIPEEEVDTGTHGKRILRTKKIPILDAHDQPQFLLGISEDVTERKEKETELRKFKAISDRSNYGNAIVDTHGSIIYLNEAFARMHGFSAPELLGCNLSVLHTEEQMGVVKELLAGLEKTGDFELEEVWHKRKDGTVFPTLMNATAISDETGVPQFLSATAIDISAIKKIENELRESEDKFRTAFRLTPDAISISRLTDGTYLEINHGFTNLTGFTEDEVIGRTSAEIGIWDDPKDLKRFAYEIGKFGQLNNMECRFRMKDGTIKTGLISARVVTINDKPHVLSETRDIDDIKRAQAESLKLAITVDQAAESVIITDTDGTIEYVNPAFERISGYSREEAIGRNPNILKSGEHPDSLYKHLWTTITGGNVWTGKLTNRKKDGTLIHEQSTISPVRDSSGKIVNFVGVSRDITREELLQQQLLQAQKMEAIGTLAGGIAHDFNNILFAIIGNTELALDDIPEGNPARNDMEKVLLAATRAAEVVKQILTFSRQGEVEHKPVDIVPIVKEALKLLKATIPQTIEIREAIDPDCGRIVGDPTQMYQVLMNLCVNSVHAMKDSKGLLTLDLRQVLVNQRSVKDHHNMPPGTYLRLSVGDTGRGIAPEILDRIFEPYFTTKNLGEGTGFGLSVVHGIVRSHHGEIAVESEVGKGTTFFVYLPTIEQLPGSQDDDFQGKPQMGSERILFVDDETMLVEMGKAKLEKLGYEVVATTSPVEALQLLRDDPNRFDLVFTDYMMPVMTGEELTRQVKLIRPEIPVVMCTGTEEPFGPDKLRELGIATMATKPLFIKEMAGILRQALDKPH